MLKKMKLMVTGILCLAMLFALAGCGGGQGSGGMGESSGDLDLDAFTGIQLQAKSPNVSVVVGDGYHVTYQLHERETVKQLEVVDGTLVFDSGKATNWQGGSEGYEVVITVPADAALASVQIYTTAGTTSLKDIALGAADLSSVSGGFQLDNVKADEVKLLTGSGEVNVQGGQIGTVDVVTTDTNVNLDSEFNEVMAESSSGECIVAYIGVCPSFKTERGIGIQSEATGGLSYKYGIKTGTLQEYILCVFRNTALEASEDSGNTHRLFGVADHQVILMQLPFHFVQSYERGSCRHGLYNDLIAGNLVHVKGMQGLSQFKKHEIGNVHYIVDGSDPDGFQSGLQPFR